MCAVVVTFNRKRLVAVCLEALARQTRPVDAVVLVDNASTDGTLEHVAAGDVAARMPVTAVRLRRNGGGAEGFHYGVREALTLDSDWLWLMDDDAEPRHDALASLLRSPHAAAAAVLAPVVEDAGGRELPINRGRVRPRWFFAPIVAAPAGDGDTPIDYCSFVGPLIRTAAARRVRPPLREMFIRFDDLEYVSRLGGSKWLVPASRIVHRDPLPVAGAGLGARLRDYARPTPFAAQWKRLYGFRNLLYCGLRDGYLTTRRALSLLLVQAFRTLLFDERRLVTLRLLVRYALDARRGRFRNVAPERWPDGPPLRYDEDVVASVTPLRARASPPNPPD